MLIIRKQFVIKTFNLLNEPRFCLLFIERLLKQLSVMQLFGALRLTR